MHIILYNHIVLYQYTGCPKDAFLLHCSVLDLRGLKKILWNLGTLNDNHSLLGNIFRKWTLFYSKSLNFFELKGGNLKMSHFLFTLGVFDLNYFW